MGRSRAAFALGLWVAMLFAGDPRAAVSVAQDREVDLGRYRLFEWGESVEVLDGGVRRAVETAVEHQLAEDGLALAGREAPELQVIIHIAPSEPVLITANAFDYGGWPGWRGWGSWYSRQVEIAEIPAGAIMIDVVEIANRRLVWRGVATRLLRGDGSPRGDRVERQIDRMFEQFPYAQK